MPLLTVTLYEFRQFLQILMWIAIPLTIVTVTVTIILHYWRKKRKTEADLLDLSQDMDSPVLPHMAGDPGDEKNAYQGVLWLRSKYRQDMESADRKNEQMKEEYGKLEKKYLDLLDKKEDEQGKTIVDDLQKRLREYEDKHHDLPDKTNDEGDKAIINDLQKKLQEYEDKIGQLERSVNEKDERGQILQQEIAGLQGTAAKPGHTAQQRGGDATETQELTIIRQQLEAAQQEKESLKNEMIEQDTLRDLVEEKTRHIEFLQNQLEQRIKLFHETEYRGREDSNRAKELQDRLTGILHQNQEQQENLRSKTNYIEKLENDMHSLKDQHTRAGFLLNEKLEREIQKTKELEAKLGFSYGLLQKIQEELNASFETQMVSYKEDGLQQNGHDKPRISGWIESPSEEEELEHII